MATVSRLRVLHCRAGLLTVRDPSRLARNADRLQVREKAEKEDEERIARGEAPSDKGPQWRPGVAYEGKQLASSHNFHQGVDVFAEPEQVTRGRFSWALMPLTCFGTSMCTWTHPSTFARR